MSDREKLIELIDRVLQCLPWGEVSTHTSKDIADHLISNGVTVSSCVRDCAKCWKTQLVTPKWIPVSERLPEESEYMIPRTFDVDILARFLVAYEGDGVFYEIAHYTGHEWITDAMLCPIDNVIAWKLIEPLPEPPKECE